MRDKELIDRMASLIRLQADIIRELSCALEQVHAVVDLEDQITQAAKERQEIL